MPEAVLVRQIISLFMLAVASHSDIKRRKVSDMVWIIFGGAGALLYVLEPPDTVTILFLTIGITIGIAGLASRKFGQADCLALIAVTVTTPAHDGIPVGLAIPVVTPVLASIYSLCYNVACNLSDLLQGSMFYELDERLHRKALAFFVLHRRRGHERFVFIAQQDVRFVFHWKSNKDKFAGNFQGYVSSALPLIPFMLLSFVLVFFFTP